MDTKSNSETEMHEVLKLNLPKAVIFRLRDEFRNWYATLSISELVRNPKLTQQIEAFERLFKAVAV